MTAKIRKEVRCAPLMGESNVGLPFLGMAPKIEFARLLHNTRGVVALSIPLDSSASYRNNGQMKQRSVIYSRMISPEALISIAT